VIAWLLVACVRIIPCRDEVVRVPWGTGRAACAWSEAKLEQMDTPGTFLCRCPRTTTKTERETGQ
jgi:hypothetical protein